MSVGLNRDRYHRYAWNGDGPLVGVTSVLKIQDALIGGDLASWGAGLAIDYLLTDDNWQGQTDDQLRTAALAQVSAARDIGTAVHARVEHILLGEPQSQTPCPRHPPEFGRVGACELLPDQVPPYIYAFSSFLAAERPEFLLVEAMVCNLKERYAGTFDFGAMLRGRRALVDVKTGKAKRSHALQLAGYSDGEFIGREGDPEQYPLPRFQDFYILYLRPEGYELVPQTVTAADRKHFRYLVRTYRALRAWEKAE